MKRLLAGVAAPAALACASLVLAAPAGAIALRSGDGLTVTSVKQLDSRLTSLYLKTAALPSPVDVRILLPAGYASHPRTRYPVLYLLDGTSGHASDWTVAGDAEKTTTGMPLIVVMPNMT